MFRVNGEKFYVEIVNSKKMVKTEDLNSIGECWTIKTLASEEGMKMLTKDKMELALNVSEESLDHNV